MLLRRLGVNQVDGGSVQIRAAHAGHANCIAALLDVPYAHALLDIEAEGPEELEGCTALTAAAAAGHIAAVETLLARGADASSAAALAAAFLCG